MERVTAQSGILNFMDFTMSQIISSVKNLSSPPCNTKVLNPSSLPLIQESKISSLVSLYLLTFLFDALIPQYTHLCYSDL